MSSLRDNHKIFAEWAEGRRNFPYEDSVGKLTIGIGRNLEDRGISDSEMAHLFRNDQDIVMADIDRSLPWFTSLDEVRQIVVFDMVFNMGISRFKGFIKTIEALENHDYMTAAHEMQDSRWFRQTGRRAHALVRAMATGELSFSDKVVRNEQPPLQPAHPKADP